MEKSGTRSLSTSKLIVSNQAHPRTAKSDFSTIRDLYSQLEGPRDKIRSCTVSQETTLTLLSHVSLRMCHGPNKNHILPVPTLFFPLYPRGCLYVSINLPGETCWMLCFCRDQPPRTITYNVRLCLLLHTYYDKLLYKYCCIQILLLIIM